MAVARAPEFAQRIRDHNETFTRFLSDPVFDADLAADEIEKAKMTLQSLVRMLPRPEKKSVKGVLKTIRGYENRRPSQGELRILYRRFIGVEEIIKDVQETKRWQR